MNIPNHKIEHAALGLDKKYLKVDASNDPVTGNTTFGSKVLIGGTGEPQYQFHQISGSGGEYSQVMDGTTNPNMDIDSQKSQYSYTARMGSRTFTHAGTGWPQFLNIANHYDIGEETYFEDQTTLNWIGTTGQIGTQIMPYIWTIGRKTNVKLKNRDISGSFGATKPGRDYLMAHHLNLDCESSVITAKGPLEFVSGGDYITMSCAGYEVNAPLCDFLGHWMGAYVELAGSVKNTNSASFKNDKTGFNIDVIGTSDCNVGLKALAVDAGTNIGAVLVGNTAAALLTGHLRFGAITTNSINGYGSMTAVNGSYDVGGSDARARAVYTGTLDASALTKSGSYQAGGTAGLTQAVTIAGTDVTHTLTFTAGLLTGYGTA